MARGGKGLSVAGRVWGMWFVDGFGVGRRLGAVQPAAAAAAETQRD
jgi:hypothetical protein